MTEGTDRKKPSDGDETQSEESISSTATQGLEKEHFSMRRWYFIRHAQSENNRRVVEDPSEVVRDFERREGDPHPQAGSLRFERLPDPPITWLGKRQVVTAGAYIRKHVGVESRTSFKSSTSGSLIFDQPANLRISHIVCSPMLRAVQTARLLQQALEVPVFVHPLLFEVGGLFTGPRTPEECDSVEHGAPSGGDAETSEGKRFGLTWEELQILCPGARLINPFQWPCKETVSDPASLRLEEYPARLSGFDAVGWAEGLGWWKGGREPMKVALGRMQSVVQWLHASTVHQQVTGELSAELDSGAALVVCHGLLTDLLFKALACTPALGSCCCDFVKCERNRLSASSHNHRHQQAQTASSANSGLTFALRNCGIFSFDLAVKTISGRARKQTQENTWCCMHCSCQCSFCRESEQWRHVRLLHYK